MIELIQQNYNLTPLDGEVWKDFPKNPQYLVSNFGRVLSKSYEYYFVCNNQWIDSKPKIVKQSNNNSKKYWRCGIMIDKKQKHHATHRMVAETFIPNPNNLPQVNHKDGNKDNNHVDNLEWISNDDNILHAWRTGLKLKDSKFPHNTRLTENQVLEIVKLSENTSTVNLAKLFNVNDSLISNIKTGVCWSHLTNIQIKLYKLGKSCTLNERFEIYDLVNSRTTTIKNICIKYKTTCTEIYKLCKWCEQNLKEKLNL